jgi:HD-like signal output (HDOD) protein
MDRDACYTAGLIHDIGRLGLAALYPLPYSKFLQATEKIPCDVLQRERELFSCDHCQAGRNLVEAWNLPNSLTEVVSRHHEPRSWREDDMLSIVYLSCRMADSLGFAAAHNLNVPNYEDLFAQIPQEERGRFPTKMEEMTLLLAAQINAMESM